MTNRDKPKFLKLVASNKRFRKYGRGQSEFLRMFSDILKLFAVILRRRYRNEPEKKLMAGILCDALYVILHYRPPSKLFTEALEWIEEKENDHLYSFENICDTLNLRKNHIRNSILTYLNRRPTDPGGPPLKLLKGGKK